MKKIIVAAVILALLIGGGIANVSASFWESNFFGNIDAEMINGVAVIGGQPMSDDDINKKIMDLFAEPLFAEPMPTPTPEPEPEPEPVEPVEDWYSYYYGNDSYDDWLGCP